MYLFQGLAWKLFSQEFESSCSNGIVPPDDILKSNNKLSSGPMKINK